MLCCASAVLPTSLRLLVPATQLPSMLLLAGAISITSVVNAPSDPTGSKFTVTFSKSNPGAEGVGFTVDAQCNLDSPLPLCCSGSLLESDAKPQISQVHINTKKFIRALFSDAKK